MDTRSLIKKRLILLVYTEKLINHSRLFFLSVYSVIHVCKSYVVHKNYIAENK